jgi:chorismate mutase
MSADLRLFAVRGATKVERNDASQILAQTEELMRELLSRNDLDPDRIVSCIFTSTHNLNAEFPAVAARNLGLNNVPLLCAQEIDVPGAMPGVVRVLVHYYAPAGHTSNHTYMGEAQELRLDLNDAQ